MTSSGSTLLFGAIPAELKPSAVEKRQLTRFLRTVCDRVGVVRPVVAIVANDEYLQDLNRKYLGHDYPTDVLSFPTDELCPLLGEIAISIDRAAVQAAEFGHNRLDEVKILLLHGTLHLMGFDHENGDGSMARQEQRWRTEFQLPETLVSRAGKSRRSAAKHRKGAVR